MFFKRITSVLLGAAFLALNGCPVSENGTEVSIQNNTAKEVRVNKIEEPQNMTIDAGTSATMYVQSRAEAFSLEFVWGDATYAGDTGYIQDSRKIRIELSGDMFCTVNGSSKHLEKEKFDQK
jgi:hypothetical protein